MHMTIRRSLTLLPALLLFCLITPPSFAQLVTATLQGTVADQSGAGVPNATITVTNTATGSRTTVQSTADGRYTVPSLQPGGPYTVEVTATGYKTLQRSGISLDVNQLATVAVQMEVGAVSQTVLVTADTPLLEASSASIGQVVEAKTIEDLPLNQRNPYALLFIVPGVTGSVGLAFNSDNISINGGRAGGTEILIDGIPAAPPLANPIDGLAVFPSVESVQEFKVQTNVYDAEFGRSAGGIINLIYKSGTNTLHGSAFEFARNSALDANSFFANRFKIPLGAFSRNQFGGSIGGPILIPKIYDGKNNTFFFFAYEGLRSGSATSLTATVPTALQRTGDFSQTVTSTGAPVVIYNPFTTVASGAGFVRTQFTGNIIPLNLIDPVAKAFLNYYPLPNQPGNAAGANNYFAQGTTNQSVNQEDLRLDKQLNERNRFFVRYSHRTFGTTPARLFPAANVVAEGLQQQLDIDNSGAFDYTFAPSSTYLLDIRAGFARILEKYNPLSLGFDPTSLGFPASIAAAADHLLFPGFAPANYYGLGDGAQGQVRHDSFATQLGGITNTKIIGNHTLKFGGEFRKLLVNVDESGASTGTYNSNPSYTQGPNPNVGSAAAGNSIASFLLGQGTGSLGINLKNLSTASDYYALFFQDDWRATAKLTVTAGLRYQVDVPRTERHNHMETFNPSLPSPVASPSGIPGLLGGVVYNSPSNRRQDPTEFTNRGPQVGFSYQLDPSTVVRGGFGIFFAPSYDQATGTFGQLGFNATTTFNSSLNGLTPTSFLRDPYATGINLPTGSSLGASTGIGSSFQSQIFQDNKVPYTENYSLDVQRQLPTNILIDVAYVGNHGVHLNKGSFFDYNLNQLTSTNLALGTALQQSVPNPFFGIIKTGPLAAATVPRSVLVAPFPQYQSIFADFPTGAFSLFDAVQVKVEKRFSQGLSFLVSFNGQKLIDNYSQTAILGQSAGLQDIYNPTGERSVSANDISRTLVVSGTYALPVGRGHRFGSDWNRAIDALAGGWQLNGIETYHTGFPLALSANNTSNSGNNALRPNTTGASAALGGPVIDRLTRYFDTSAFSQPAPFTFGNTSRTLANVRMPSFHNLDASLFKTIGIVNRLKVELRFEAFNALNQVVFAGPNTSLLSGQFGVISGQANSPRTLQFGVKAIF